MLEAVVPAAVVAAALLVGVLDACPPEEFPQAVSPRLSEAISDTMAMAARPLIAITGMTLLSGSLARPHYPVGGREPSLVALSTSLRRPRTNGFTVPYLALS